jgi:hypothetical protein
LNGISVVDIPFNLFGNSGRGISDSARHVSHRVERFGFMAACSAAW